MSDVQDVQVIQYVPFASFVHPSFWHSLTEIKLNVDKLSENNKQIHGRYTYQDDIGSVFEVDGTSFNKTPDKEQLYLNVTGTIMNKNTIEDFKDIDKAALLNGIGELIWPTVKAKTWITNPKSLLNFIVLSFADTLKTEGSGWVGWERNDKGNFGPKLANMSASMDPIKLADASSDLNIRLMKWRLVPEIDVDIMKETKCLLLGAGTLGCHVARDLLAWGFRYITFMDSGKVSYSNPTRQVLFNHKDCVDARYKAEAAADNLRMILPTVTTRGIVAHIPMPGHPVGESLRKEITANLTLISDAIKEHDAVFMLLDTREARWLPTVLAAHHGKIVINAALGFDSYLVMRHGLAGNGSNAVSMNDTIVPGRQLGCYFCNDVTAPGNSLKDRTLDQQCTVTRPGVAAVAGALAVEILVGLLQHPLRAEAPANYNISENEEVDQGVLGPVPHSIRGFLHSFNTILPTCQKFKQCIACSDIIIEKYRERGTDFLMDVFNSGKYLERLTGLEELHMAAEMSEILTISDEDPE